MTLESNSLFILAVLIIIPSLIYMIMKGKHSVKLLLCFVLAYASIVLTINFMFFPLNIGLDKSSIELVTPIKHDLTPFKYFANTFELNENYDSQVSAEAKKEVTTIKALERQDLIYSYILFFCLSCIESSCVYLSSNERHKKKNLFAMSILLIVLDILYVYTYYNASYAFEGFDTSIFLFQIVGFVFGVGVSRLFVRCLLNKEEEHKTNG